ncbi:MAG: hypothetical protein K6F53_01095 [Lachnospiraceae bacterium]|nr:hypothetical protein [Lachnospiraceae bacterium]
MLLDAFRKNTKKSTRRFLALLIFGAVAALLVILVLRLKQDGDGLLFTDNNAMADNEVFEEAEGDLVEIRIRTDEILIGGRTYPEASAASSVLREAAGSGKSFLIIDDYATAAGYEQILKILSEAGVENSRIEEKKEQ